MPIPLGPIGAGEKGAGDACGEGSGAHVPVMRLLSLHAVDLCIRRDLYSGTGEKFVSKVSPALSCVYSLTLTHLCTSIAVPCHSHEIHN